MKVLLAVDGSGFSKLAERVIAKQYRPENTEVCVVHALEWHRAIPACFSFARGNTYGPQFDSAMKKSREQAAVLVSSVAHALQERGFRASTAVVEGDPVFVILGRAAEWGADLIVMGSHGHTGLNRILFGSLSRAVARGAPGAVEIVCVSRPERTNKGAIDGEFREPIRGCHAECQDFKSHH
jgi:nucleotide-binding universal stress UspA family protein